MKPYRLEPGQTGLDDLPPLDGSPGYAVLDGDPRASIRFDMGSGDSRHRLGIWRCTPGTFSCTEKGDELQTVLEGKLTLVREDGSSEDFGPGDSIYTERGERVTWKIVETVTKVFFTHDIAGRD